MIRKYHIHQPSLFLLARVAECKRQDYAIEMLHKMALNGCTAHLYIVGQYSDDHNAWYDHLISMIGQYGLAEYVHFLGPLSRKENSILARVCTASLIASDVSCLGNVFHELLADGAVLICHDSAGSLNSYIEDRSNGFLISSPDEGAAVMEGLIKGELPSEEIRQNAVRTSSRLMRSWEQRVEDELGLIEAAVQRHKESP